ncbi:MAG: hypothetical protein E6R04_11990 [Spirochaetes bacterium]|nr:MAG: hypothetical protein E6R04_11990 [Spirochaetota bacterium]
MFKKELKKSSEKILKKFKVPKLVMGMETHKGIPESRGKELLRVMGTKPKEEISQPERAEEWEKDMIQIITDIHPWGYSESRKQAWIKLVELTKTLLQKEREKVRKLFLEKLNEEFDIFLCCTGRCEHKGRGESDLFLDAKKQIINQLTNLK